MEEWIAVRKIVSKLNNLLQKAQSTAEVESIVINFIPKHIKVDGVATVKHIVHIKKLFISHTYGVYNQMKNIYFDNNIGLTGYIVRHKVPIFINKESDIPSGVKLVGQYKEGEHYAAIPILSSDGEVTLIVMVVKQDEPLTARDITTIRSIVIQAGITYEKLYLKERAEKFIIASRKIADFIIHFTEYPTSNILEIGKEALKLCKDIIPGVEAGSILMRSGDHFIFIAELEYGNKLLQEPPLSYENELQWYGLGEDSWKKGIPRILTTDEILERDKIRYVSEKGKTVYDIKATLGIPIVINGEVKYLLNLDNFSTPAAFDDVDIDIAMLLGYILPLIGEIGSLYKADILQHKLATGIKPPKLSSFCEINTSRKAPQSILDNIVDNLNILDPNAIYAMHGSISKGWKRIYPQNNGSQYDLFTKYADISKGEGEIYIPEKKTYITWTILHLGKEKVGLLVVKEYFIPYIGSYSDFQTFITRYIHGFTYLAYLCTTLKNYALNISENIGMLLENIQLEPKGHIKFMEEYGTKLGKKLLSKLYDDFIYGLHLHDIGKLLIPDREKAQSDKMLHPKLGNQLLESTQLDKYIQLANMVKYNEETPKGDGPYGLIGSEIPREAQIVHVLCDMHHLISNGYSIQEVFDILHNNAPEKYSFFILDIVRNIFNVE